MAESGRRKKMSVKAQAAILMIAAVLVVGAAFGMVMLEKWWRGVDGHTGEVTLTQDGMQKMLPAFELVDSAGETIRLADLQGRPWVAAFGFTRCRGICPAMAHGYRDLQEAMADDPDFEGVKLVWFTVDPEHDTPEQLQAYGELEGADPQRWIFVTGEKDALWQLSEQGFLLPVEEDPENVAMPFSHTARFVLVDAQGRIRSYYSGVQDTERQALIDDLRTLAANGK